MPLGTRTPSLLQGHESSRSTAGRRASSVIQFLESLYNQYIAERGDDLC